ncbi:unnamed protein product, partial [Choristocarpus tenellus]
MSSRCRVGLSAYAFILALVLPRSTTAQPCSPNLCSGHGSCESSGDGSTSTRQCNCNTKWMGADCSLKVCPYGIAWSDTAEGTDDSHNTAECSNRGRCNREMGFCECDQGFEGQACDRKSCPHNCHGHGKCQSISYFASVKDLGEGTLYTYDDVWDADIMYGCNCDIGYTGPSCQLRSCPTGDDPLTGTEEDPDGEQYNEQQEVTCTATGGVFTLAFRHFTTIEIAYDASADKIVDALEDLPSIYSSYDSAISVQFATTETEACVSSGHTWTVEFLQDFGDLPLLVPGTSGLTHTTSGTDPSVVVAESVTGTKENFDCSGRGLCDQDHSVCTCEPEFDTSNGSGSEGQRGDCGYVVTAVTHCPGEVSCSGHGVCSGSPTYDCDCSDGWTGSDCSLKTCSYGKSWFAVPTADNTAHLDRSECSGMGECDRSMGVCRCIDGFEGSACDRMSCPGGIGGGVEESDRVLCNDHGQCMTMSMLAVEASDSDGQEADYTYGATPNDPKTWDHDMVQGCFCDHGYFGHDCSQRSCPYGDDPDTHSQDNEIQEILCTDSDSTDGSLVVLTFRQAETDSLEPTTTEEELEAALEDLSTLTDVSVSCDTGVFCSNTTSTCLVEFLTELGNVPLISVSVTDVDTVDIFEYQAGTKEYVECSFKGLCDYELGECRCFPGYGSSDGQNGIGTLGDCGYILPFSPGLREHGNERPMSRYP